MPNKVLTVPRREGKPKILQQQKAKIFRLVAAPALSRFLKVLQYLALHMNNCQFGVFRKP